MKNVFYAVAFVLLISVGIFAQTTPLAAEDSDKYAAEIEWVRYKVTAAGASVMLPKMPVAIGGVGGDSCKEIAGTKYFAYADESVYEFIIVTKALDPPLTWCDTKIHFGKQALEWRISQLPEYSTFKVSDETLHGRKVKVYRSETANERSVRLVVTDFANDRWIELAITGRPNKAPNEKRFFESLALTAEEGNEITSGSPSTLGNKGIYSMPLLPDTSPMPLAIKARPRAGYTEIARKAGIQGSVRLSVTFLANGGIGNVTVLKDGLTHGLIQQAESAAKRIVFLPSGIGGKPVTVVRQVEYHFNIF